MRGNLLLFVGLYAGTRAPGGLFAASSRAPFAASSRAPFAAISRRAACGLVAAVATSTVFAGAGRAESSGTSEQTFSERSLGLVFRQASQRVQVARVVLGSAAAERGVLPLSYLYAIDGVRLGNATVEDVTALLQRAPRPITLTFDAAAYAGLSPDEGFAQAATAQGFETDRVRITPLARGADSCGLQSREGDIIEVEFSARVVGPSADLEFDSSSMRSGRPFAFLLGNGDVVRGFELGCFEMCIGDERLVRVPPALGLGRKGSRVFGVPPAATLNYYVRMVSINGQVDPAARRDLLPDEQRF